MLEYSIALSEKVIVNYNNAGMAKTFTHSSYSDLIYDIEQKKYFTDIKKYTDFYYQLIGHSDNKININKWSVKIFNPEYYKEFQSVDKFYKYNEENKNIEYSCNHVIRDKIFLDDKFYGRGSYKTRVWLEEKILKDMNKIKNNPGKIINLPKLNEDKTIYFSEEEKEKDLPERSYFYSFFERLFS